MPGVLALINSPHLQSLDLSENSILYDSACTNRMNNSTPIGPHLTKLGLEAEITPDCENLLARVAAQRQEEEKEKYMPPKDPTGGFGPRRK